MQAIKIGRQFRLADYKTNTINYLALVLILFLSMGLQHSIADPQSSLVFEGTDGKLDYKKYANKGEADKVNTIPDFSTVGYKDGNEPIPFVPAVEVIEAPSGGDDFEQINKAIKAIEGRPLQPDGFRGALLIKAGRYSTSKGFRVSKSGVVIRGEGSQKGAGGTKIYYPDKRKMSGFEFRSQTGPVGTPKTKVAIVDDYVPVGATSFEVADASAYTVGDSILISYKLNNKWLDALKMNGIWKRGPGSMQVRKKVVGIKGNVIEVNSAVVNAIQKQYGGAEVSKYTWEGLTHVGLEGIRLESAYENDKDDQHAYIGVVMHNVKHAWLRQVTTQYFGHGCFLAKRSHFITVEDCANVEPKGPTTGGTKYSFVLDKGSSHVMMQRCFTYGGRHDFVSVGRVVGPNVFVDCHAANTRDDTGPHNLYATGQLYDNVKADAINVQNRRKSGSGHGWTGAQIVFWNCKAYSSICENPISSRNFAIGFKGKKKSGKYARGMPDGFWEHHNVDVSPRSLYYRQLKDRLGNKPRYWFMIPEQENNNIWAELEEWRGDGVFGGPIVVWAKEFVNVGEKLPLVARIRALSMMDGGASISWAKEFGPGDVVFEDGKSLTTNATFKAPGNYFIKFEVRSGTKKLSRKIYVSVNDPGTRIQVVEAEADSFVRGGRFKDKNYNGKKILSIQNEGKRVKDSCRAYIRFDIAALRAHTKSATLRLYQASLSKRDISTLKVYLVDNDNWEEAGLTFANAPKASRAVLATSKAGAKEYVLFDVTSAVKKQKDGKVTICVESPGKYQTSISARESEIQSRRPILFITPDENFSRPEK